MAQTIHQPSMLEKYISTLPKDLQTLALQAVVKEHTRWLKGDLTEKEKLFQKEAKELGIFMAKTIDQIAFNVLGASK